MQKRKRRPRAKYVRKVEPEARIVRVVEMVKVGSGSSELWKRVRASSEQLWREKSNREAGSSQQRPPVLSLFGTRKRLWAWLQQADTPALKELYEQVGFGKQGQRAQHGIAELGEILRQYFKMRAYYGSAENEPGVRCPFCPCTAEVIAGSGCEGNPPADSKKS